MTPESGRRPDIQGLRAIAVIAVLLFHAGLPFPGGFVGVDMFFVVSGYVITLMLLRELRASGRISFGHFYLRRFKRLAPALAVVTVVTVLASVLLQSPFGAQQTTAMTAVGVMGFVANVVIAMHSGDYFAAAAERNPLLHTWSLSVEEQFYFLFPLVLALAWTRLRGRTAGVAALVGGLSVVSFGLGIAVSLGVTGPFSALWGGFYAMPPRLWEFGVGVLLALLNVRFAHRRLGLALAAIGLGLVVASLFAITPAAPFPGPLTLLPVLGTALLLVPVTDRDHALSRGLSHPLLVRIGDLSYSLYLWHWPFVTYAKLLWPGRAVPVVLATLVSVVPAVLSYRLLEEPVRRAPVSRRAAVARLVAAAVVPVVAAAGILWGGAHTRWGQQWPIATSDVPSEVDITGCVHTTTTNDMAACLPAGLDHGRLVLVVGDSQAAALIPGVLTAAAQTGRQVLYTSAPGCPFLDADTTGSKAFGCRHWQAGALALVAAARPDVLVIANRSVGYTQPGLRWRTLVDARGLGTEDRGEAVRRYEDALARILREAVPASRRVVITDNMVEPDDVDVEVSLLRLILPARMPESFDGARSLALRQPSVEVHARLAAHFPSVRTLDPAAFQCAAKSCPVYNGSDSRYADPLHFSASGSELLVPGWIETFEQD